MLQISYRYAESGSVAIKSTVKVVLVDAEVLDEVVVKCMVQQKGIFDGVSLVDSRKTEQRIGTSVTGALEVRARYTSE